MAGKQRILGCLYGQAIGDALGTRYEFEPSVMVKGMMTKDSRDDGFLPILGGGPFTMEQGQVTDDTELAMALARSLVEKGTYVSESVARAYRFWYESDPPDIGLTTRCALGNVDPKMDDWYGQICANSLANNKQSLSNGCLMRISPLAIAGHGWGADKLRMTAATDCRMTNPNEIAQDAVGCYVTAIAALLNGLSRQESYNTALTCIQTGTVRDLLAAAAEAAIPVKVRDKLLPGDGKSMGYLGVALQSAFHELLHAPSFEIGLKSAIARGGDTDTNGCITGALIGAYFGADAIPEEWKSTVVQAKSERLKSFPVVGLSDLEDVALKLAGCEEPNLECDAK